MGGGGLLIVGTNVGLLELMSVLATWAKVAVQEGIDLWS